MSHSPESGEVMWLASGCVFTDFKREGFIERWSRGAWSIRASQVKYEIFCFKTRRHQAFGNRVTFFFHCFLTGSTFCSCNHTVDPVTKEGDLNLYLLWQGFSDGRCQWHLKCFFTWVYQPGTPLPHPIPPETMPINVLRSSWYVFKGPPLSPLQDDRKVPFSFWVPVKH